MPSKIDVVSIKGVKVQTQLTLPKNFDEKVVPELLAQAFRVYQDRTHPGNALVKTRAEVNMTTKKVYKQKGTGGARHGSKKAPIYVGGGVAHGPKGVKRVLSLPLKMRRKALYMALTQKTQSGQMIAVTGLAKLSKSAEASKLVAKIAAKRALFVFSKENMGVSKFVRNLKNAEFVSYKDLNAYKVLSGGILLMDSEIFTKEKKEGAGKKK